MLQKGAGLPCRRLEWNLSGAMRLSKPLLSRSGKRGSLDVTVSRIAKRAGMSSALAHHYFGSKEAMFLAAMRHVLSVYGAEIRGALVACDTPRDRLRALVRVSFTGSNFRPARLSRHGWEFLSFWRSVKG